jgi:hypothetical protein
MDPGGRTPMSLLEARNDVAISHDAREIGFERRSTLALFETPSHLRRPKSGIVVRCSVATTGDRVRWS